MKKKIILGTFFFLFLLILSSIYIISPKNSQAEECCTDLCTTERYAECNGVSIDFCSICTDSSFFCYRCPQISCGSFCSDYYCNGVCGANCTAVQDPDCIGSCCGDGTCNGTETNASCSTDCPVSITCVTNGLCDGSCPVNCTTGDDLDCAGSCCGDGTCNGTETNASCSTDCSVLCVAEICDGSDNDCDTSIDEDLTAPLNDNQNGVCSGSFKSCSGIGGWLNDYSGVANNEWPNELSCADGFDNDCDGQTDANDISDCLASCLVNSDCDDSNPCTVDICNIGICAYSNENNGTQNCGTGCERCWAPDLSTTAFCSSWDSDCDDSNECTQDICSADTCVYNNETNTTSCTGGICDGLGVCDTEGVCADECTIGEIGCIDANTNYTCGEGGDGDACLDKISNTCNAGDTCNATTGNCELAACVENWVCTAWSNCISDTQTKICTDSNDCGTTILKPIESQSCSVSCTDNDQDGYGNPSSVSCMYFGADCDDSDYYINPGINDICGDGIDQDCQDEDLSCGDLYSIIKRPNNNSNFSVDQYISLNGGVLGGKAPYTFLWRSDKDGDLGTDQFLSILPNILSSSGLHEITLKVSDDNGVFNEANIFLNISAAGEMTVNIDDWTTIFSRSEFLFLGANIRNEIGEVTYIWESDKEGIFSTDTFANADISSWELGNHLISLLVTDSLGTSRTAKLNIIVNDFVAQLYPETGRTFFSGDSIWMSSNILGGTAPYIYKIESNVDGLLRDFSSTNAWDNFSINTLSQGVHVLTLTVTDFVGLEINEVSQITINPIVFSEVDCFNFTDCDDENDCTMDTCYNPGLMSASCFNSQINTCVDSDLCCPAICDNTQDNDCAIIDHDDPAKVLLIYNDRCATDTNNNGVKDNLEQAFYYQMKRNIPDENMLAVNPSVGSSGCSHYYWLASAYPDFIDDIVTPIQNKLSILGEESIDYFLLIGLPTTVYVDTSSHTTRSLDNILMTPYSVDVATDYPEYWAYNPYRENSPSIDVDKGHFNHGYKYSGENMYLVTRIFSNQLIDRALYGEKYIYNQPGYYSGMGYVETKAFFTDRDIDDNYATGPSESDKKMAFGKRIFDMTGWDYKWETTGWEIGEVGATFTDDTSALIAPDALWYEGWYNYNKYTDGYIWKAGSAACDLNSNSGPVFLKNAFKKGLTVGTGVTGEPYLTGHPMAEVFIYYMLNGYNFAEASALSYPALKWRDISYGDPLYNPNKVKTAIKDTVNPLILQISEQNTDINSAISASIYVSLDVNSMNPEVATFKVDYGLTATYGQTIDYDEITTTEKSFLLEFLSPDTLYHYMITAKDPVANISTTLDRTFKTSSDNTMLAPGFTINASNQIGDGSLIVDFTSTPAELPISYYWDFGDDSNSSVQNPSHTFSTKGYYNVLLQVEFGSGLKRMKQILIIIK